MDFVGIVFGLVCILLSVLLSLPVIDFLFPWLKYDVKQIWIMLSAKRQIKKSERCKPIYTMMEKLIDQAKYIPNKIFMYYGDEAWSYQNCNQYCNQVARVVHEARLGKGDVVAIFMHSCPQYVGVWFGIGKTGATSAFINDTLRGRSLLQCLNISGCISIVVSNDPILIEAIEDIKEQLQDEITIYVLGSVQLKPVFDYKDFDELLDKKSNTEVPSEWRNSLHMKDHFCYVYTSGTTGLPKAAIIRHDRSWLMGNFFNFVNCTSDDIVYSPLPIYHSSAGLLGILGTINLGCSIIIRKKFSASRFWEDCRRYNATFVQYIGETIRYVCDQPPHRDDKNHRVKIIAGSGLRPLVWKKFLDRFGKHIRVQEVYGSTEGNAYFMNNDNNLGSIGMHSPLMKATGLLRFVKYDTENDEIVRDKSGRCVDVPDGTPGLLIGKISDKTPFNGYHNNDKQTQSKILRDVFKDGDSYFNTGDILRKDPDYHVYFIDRVGDTFRWKGHNVSTNEVSDVMSNAPGIKEVNVYGVEIPGNEGRAGMMAVLLKEDTELDSTGVYRHACECLSSYARPVFLRVKQEIDLTGTFKHKKVQLRIEGCNLKNMNGDPIYYMDHAKACYSLLSQDVYSDILNNTIRF